MISICHLSACVCVCSAVSDSATPWTVAHEASLSMEFSRQDYRSGLPFPTPICHLYSCPNRMLVSYLRASLVTQRVKHLPMMRETQV